MYSKGLNLDSCEKRQNYRLQIRRNQIQKFLRISRQQLPQDLTPSQAIKLCIEKFEQLHQLYHKQPCLSKNNERFSSVMKLLRDINSNELALQIYIMPNNLRLLILMQNQNRLDAMCTIFLHQIILNITADMKPNKQHIQISGNKRQKYDDANFYRSNITFSDFNMSLQSLNLKTALCQNNLQVFSLCLKIIGNMLQKDYTCKTIYYLATKLQIFTIILKLVWDRKELYSIVKNDYERHWNSMLETAHNDKRQDCLYQHNKSDSVINEIESQSKLLPTLFWLCNKLIQMVLRFKLQNIINDWCNFINCINQQYITCFLFIDSSYKSYGNQINKADGHCLSIHGQVNARVKQQINNFLVYFKNIVKTNIIQHDVNQEHVIRIHSHFSATNVSYLQYLAVLTFNTDYSINATHLQELVTSLLQNHASKKYKNVIILILRCIRNSLKNDASNYRTIISTFIQYSQIKPLTYHHLSVNGENDDRYIQLKGQTGQFLRASDSLEQKQKLFYNIMHKQRQYDEAEYSQYSQQYVQFGKGQNILCYFVYFLQRQDTQDDMTEIISSLICSQGGIGIFEQAIQQLVQCQPLKQKIQQLGFQIIIQL